MFYACRVYIYHQKLHGFIVKITKYQLKKRIGLVLNKSRQYHILGFDLIMHSDPKSFGDFRARVLQNIRVFAFFTTSILVKLTKKILVECMDTDGFL